MNIKRLFFLILLITLTLAGCGKAGTESPAEEVASSPAAEQSSRETEITEKEIEPAEVRDDSPGEPAEAESEISEEPAEPAELEVTEVPVEHEVLETDITAEVLEEPEADPPVTGSSESEDVPAKGPPSWVVEEASVASRLSRTQVEKRPSFTWDGERHIISEEDLPFRRAVEADFLFPEKIREEAPGRDEITAGSIVPDFTVEETLIVEETEDLLEPPTEFTDAANQVLVLARELKELNFTELIEAAKTSVSESSESPVTDGPRTVSGRNYNYTPEQYRFELSQFPPGVPNELVNTAEPFLVLHRPTDRSLYYDKVVISGTVRNSRQDPGRIDEITSLSWYLRGINEPETVGFSEEGDFSFDVSMEGMSETRQLIIQAENSDGMESSISLILQEDIRPPLVEFISPVYGGSFSESVKLKGRVVNFSGSDSFDRIERVTLALPQTGENKEIELDSRGEFEIEIESSDEDLLFAVCRAENIREAAGEASMVLYSEGSRGTGPFVNITSPSYHGAYGGLVNVRGWVSKSKSDIETAADLENLTWKLLGTRDGGKINPDRNGYFEFSFSTIGMEETICMIITAEGKDGGVAFTDLVLHAESQPAVSKLFSPVDNTLYDGDYMEVRGIVGNNIDSMGQVDELKSLYWWVPGLQEEKSPVFFEEDGSFLYSMDLSGMSGPVILEILAETISGSTSGNTVRLYDGTRLPEIRLYQPSPESRYGIGVQVSGNVFDPYSGLERYGGIETLEYEVVAMEYQTGRDTSLSGTILPDVDGNFLFSFVSAEMEGPQAVTLRASSLNGNQGSFSFTMLPGDSDIPTFAVRPDMGEILIDWEDIPGVLSYTLYYTTDGTLPSSENGNSRKGVTSPLRLSGLPMGTVCSFLLSAGTELGTGWSSVKKTIPIGQEGFSLTAEGAYESVNLSWQAFPQIPEYRIYRKEEVEAVYSDISGAVGGNSFIDPDVSFGREYWYRISPDGFPDISGREVAAEPLAVPDSKVNEKIGISTFIPLSIDVEGGYAYVAAGEGGFKIVDVGDPNRISVVGEVTEFNAEKLFLYGDYAYIAAGQEGMKILNIQEPRDPILLGNRASTNARDVAAVGKYAYIADGEAGLKVIDVSNFRSPKRLKSLTDFPSERLAIEGNFLYLSNRESGMSILDISDPDSPELIGEYKTETMNDHIIKNQKAYISLGSGKIQILDLVDPLNPSLISEIEIREPGELSLKGNYLFASAGQRGFVIINVANSDKPYIFDEVTGSNVNGLDINEDTLYLAAEDGLRIIDIHLQGGGFSIAECEVPGRPDRVRLDSGRAYLAAGGMGVFIIDISDPENIDDSSWIGFGEASDAEDFAFYGDHVLLADGEGGVKIFSSEIKPVTEETEFNINESIDPSSVPGIVTQVGTVHVDGDADIRNIIVQDGFAYIADYNDGLSVVDLGVLDDSFETPVNLESLSSLKLDEPLFMAVDGNRLYTACKDEVVIIDITDQVSLIPAGSVPRKRIKSLGLKDSILYMNDYAGIYVYSVEDPENPELIGQRDSGFAESIWVGEDFAYLCEGYMGLSVLDISHPGGLEPVSICDTIYALASEAEGDYAFVVDAVKFNVVQIFIPEWLTR